MISPAKIFSSKRDHEKSVFLYQNQQISWQEFCANVTSLADKIRKTPDKNWAIYLEDTFLFAIGFFALLLAKKTIILPHNIQPKTLEILSDAKILTEISFDKNATLKTDFLSEISLDAEIIFFTSGSSGSPKKIHKKFLHLEAEICDISKMWKNDSEIYVSTVTNQHIYGLLFRLLLPLSQGILIDSAITFSPEELAAKKFSKITLISSPAFLKRLTSEDVFKANFEYIFSSGGLLAKDDAFKASKIFNNFPTEILGSTETGGVAWRNQKNSEIWTRFSEVKIKLNDSASLMVKSPYIAEYDYIEMGDTAEMLDEDHFFLKARNDRIIKIEEKRISLNEIENRLFESDLIKNCHATIFHKKRQVIGVVIELSETGKNFLEKNEKSALNLLLKKQLLQYFEPILVPRKWRYVEDFPINSQGKLLHEEIKKIFQE